MPTNPSMFIPASESLSGLSCAINIYDKEFQEAQVGIDKTVLEAARSSVDEVIRETSLAGKL